MLSEELPADLQPRRSDFGAPSGQAREIGVISLASAHYINRRHACSRTVVSPDLFSKQARHKFNADLIRTDVNSSASIIIHLPSLVFINPSLSHYKNAIHQNCSSHDQRGPPWHRRSQHRPPFHGQSLPRERYVPTPFPSVMF